MGAKNGRDDRVEEVDIHGPVKGCQPGGKERHTDSGAPSVDM